MAADGIEARLRDLGGFIRDQRQRGQMSLRKLSELAGISNPYLSQIERGLRKPSAEILQAIARALQISSETLYVRAGFLDREHGTGVADAIAHDPRLDDVQKRALAELYRRMLADALADRPPGTGSGSAAGPSADRSGDPSAAPAGSAAAGDR